MENDFIQLVQLLEEGEIVTREEVEAGLLALEDHSFSFPTQEEYFRELLRSALAGNSDAFYTFRLECRSLIKKTPEEVEEELRQTAADLYGDSWKTPLWYQICEAVEYGEREEWDHFEELLLQVEDEIELSLIHI